MKPKRTFDQWQELVNCWIIARCGLGIEDLPDYDYQAAYRANRDPEAVAKAVIKAARDY